LALDAQHHRERRCAGELGKRIGVSNSEITQFGLLDSSAITCGAQQQLPVVVQLARDDTARHLQPALRILVGPKLGQPQHWVASLRTAYPAEEATVARHPGHRSAIRRTTVQQIVGQVDAVPRNDVIDSHERHQVTTGPLGMRDPQRVAIQVQADARGGGVERIQQLSHSSHPPNAVQQTLGMPRGVGHAPWSEGTAAAPRIVHGRRKLALLEQVPDDHDRLADTGGQRVIDPHLVPTAVFASKHHSDPNRRVEHLP
jgi:hypothetical protein